MVINDLLREPTECIVNAANGGLSHGGGVALAIADAAGRAFFAECTRIIKEGDRIPIGDAIVTTAGALPFKGVIHAVGPRLRDGDEQAKVVRTLHAAFPCTHERGWKPLAFTAIGSGIYSVPTAICARAYVRAVDEFFAEHPGSGLTTIRLCLIKGPMMGAVKAEVSAVSPKPA